MREGGVVRCARLAKLQFFFLFLLILSNSCKDLQNLIFSRLRSIFKIKFETSEHNSNKMLRFFLGGMCFVFVFADLPRCQVRRRWTIMIRLDVGLLLDEYGNDFFGVGKSHFFFKRNSGRISLRRFISRIAWEFRDVIERCGEDLPSS